MGYKEFHFEKTYEAPNLDGFLEKSTAAISNVFKSLTNQQLEKRKTADQFAYDLDKGAFENDTKVLGELAKNVVDRGRQELHGKGSLSLDTQHLMKDGQTFQQMSTNQMKRSTELRQLILDKGKEDPYYNPDADLDLVKEATHGKNNEVDFRTRGERLSEAEKNIGGVDSFKFHDYRAHYVKDVIGAQTKESEVPLKNGSSKTNFTQRAFWDSESGKPGVTDKHAIDFVDSEPRVALYYDKKVDDQLSSEIQKMKSSGDSRVAWMKGKSDDEIKSELISDPSKNLINKKNFGARVREAAKYDLEEADRVNTKVSYQNLDSKTDNRWKNNNILHENSINSFAQESKSQATGETASITTYGPGGRFTQKNGRPIQMETTNPVRTDIRRGITTRDNKGSMKLNMTGYQLMPVKKGMAPFVLQGSTPEAMIEEIKKMPLEYFDPEGKVALQPDLKIGLNGYTLNEAGVLNDINDKMFNLADEIRKAGDDGDKTKQANLSMLKQDLDDLRDMIGDGDYDQRDLMFAANKAGVKKVKDDWIIPADNSDVANIKNISGGFDLRDESFWSPEMKAVQQAYKERYAEAQASGYKVKEEPKTDSGPATVNTQEEYDKLASGTEYLGPDGKRYKKK